jgi:hypothetical protein
MEETALHRLIKTYTPVMSLTSRICHSIQQKCVDMEHIGRKLYLVEYRGSFWIRLDPWFIQANPNLWNGLR